MCPKVENKCFSTCHYTQAFYDKKVASFYMIKKLSLLVGFPSTLCSPAMRSTGLELVSPNSCDPRGDVGISSKLVEAVGFWFSGSGFGVSECQLANDKFFAIGRLCQVDRSVTGIFSRLKPPCYRFFVYYTPILLKGTNVQSQKFCYVVRRHDKGFHSCPQFENRNEARSLLSLHRSGGVCLSPPRCETDNSLRFSKSPTLSSKVSDAKIREGNFSIDPFQNKWPEM